PAWDLFVCMDDANATNTMRMFGSDPEAKIHKLLEYASSDRDIADPWYTGDFAETYDDVVAGCTGLYHFLRSC
ncbi:MAG: low molecular weight phosphotyrosine protein phosphatase, partial [Raoultibacter sp.]